MSEERFEFIMFDQDKDLLFMDKQLGKYLMGIVTFAGWIDFVYPGRVEIKGDCVNVDDYYREAAPKEVVRAVLPLANALVLAR